MNNSLGYMVGKHEIPLTNKQIVNLNKQKQISTVIGVRSHIIDIHLLISTPNDHLYLMGREHVEGYGRDDRRKSLEKCSYSTTNQK